ncbi:glycosyltransferase family 4 protein [Marinobacter halotolerans]|uniref:glycosyltransferase family 4 protein n=1 Tax=Marinobacter halotolerans TaxID=1569211 RepID=UPI0012490966|nr:glycosyltransferase family 4 protein [Marinobacter halotolerans]
MSRTVWIINQYASTPQYGYAGRHYYLGQELAKQGYRVYLITSSSHHLLREKPSFDSAFRFEGEGGFTVVWVNMPDYSEAHSKIRALGWLLFSWRIIKLSKFIKDSPDVIVCSSPSLLSFLGAKKLSKRFKARLVFEVRDIWPLTLTEIGGHRPSHPFIRLMQWVEDKAYRDSDVVISNLKNSVHHMISRGMDPRKFFWIPNGFSLLEVSQKAALNSLALEQIPSGKFLVGYTGAIGTANALDTLIAAAERLKEYSEIAFVLVGAGKEKRVLKQLVIRKNLKNVYFVDPIPKIEIQAMLAKFDACYIGLTKDPIFRFGVSPNKLFDYLYSGKPIIYAVDSDDYKPVEEAEAGLQVPAQDEAKLSEAVLKLYEMSAEQRQTLGNNGRKLALDQYEYSQLAHQFADVLFPEDPL